MANNYPCCRKRRVSSSSSSSSSSNSSYSSSSLSQSISQSFSSQSTSSNEVIINECFACNDSSNVPRYILMEMRNITEESTPGCIGAGSQPAQNGDFLLAYSGSFNCGGANPSIFCQWNYSSYPDTTHTSCQSAYLLYQLFIGYNPSNNRGGISLSYCDYDGFNCVSVFIGSLARFNYAVGGQICNSKFHVGKIDCNFNGFPLLYDPGSQQGGAGYIDYSTGIAKLYAV